MFHCSTPGSQDLVADATNRYQVWVRRWNIAPQLSQEPFELEQICQWLKCAPRWEKQSINRVFHCSTPGSQDIVADATNRYQVWVSRWNIAPQLSQEPFELEQICQWLKCAPRWEEQSINRVFHCSTPGSQDIVADVTNRYQVWVSRWNIAPQLSQEPFELEQICQWLKCAPRWEEQSINRVFHCCTTGSQDIVADATNRYQVWVSRLNIAPQLSQEPFELDQICQWLKCAPRWEEQCINRVFHCSTTGSQDIVADATNRYQVWVSRLNIAPQLSQESFELKQIYQWLKCAPRWEEQCINRVFHWSTPGSQDIVADATNRYQVWVSRLNIAPQLSQEPFELDQICQWLKCAPRWEEQCINRVFHCSTTGSQDIVADATNRYQVWVSRLNIAPQLSQESFELKQIYQWLKCAPRWEEQCINRVFHCSTPGSQDIVADETNRYQVWVSCWNIALQLSLEPFELDQICQWLKCAPRWEEQCINRVFHCSTPGSQDIVADAINRYQVWVSRWNIAPQLSQEPFELEQICQWLKCAPRWEKQSINRVFHCSTPGSQDIVADATNRYQVWVSRLNIAPQLSQESFELEQIYQWLKCAPRWEEQCINRVFHCSTPGSQDIVADETNRYQVWVSCWNIALQLSQEPFELDQICQWLKCAPRWEEQCINRVFHCSTPGSQDIVADGTNRYQVWVSRWNIAPQLSQEPFELEQICQWLKWAPRWEKQSINRVFHCSTPGSQDIVADATNRYQVWVSRWNIAPQLSQEPFELEQICQWLICAPRWEEQSINGVFHCSTPGSQDKLADATDRYRVY